MTVLTTDTTRTRRVAGYVRVSSREQAEEQQALKQQTARVKDAGATEIFTDVLSGRREDRPELQRLMALVEKGEVDEVIFTRIDRLTRSLSQLSKCIEIFQASKVNLRILDQHIDLSTSAGRMMARHLGNSAEWESDLLSERVQYGKAFRRKCGSACESAPRGYVVIDDAYQRNTAPVLCLLSDRPHNYQEIYENCTSNCTNYCTGACTEDQPIEQPQTKTVADLARDLIDIFFEAKTPRATLKQFNQRYGIERRNQRKGEATNVDSPASHSEPQPNFMSRRRSKEKDWPSEILYWTESGLRNWLVNPVLEGNTVYQKWIQKGKYRKRSSEPPEVLEDTHPKEALVSHDEAAYIRETIEIHKNMGGGSFIPGDKDADTPQYRPYAYLNALVYCYDCGSKCRTKTSCKGKYTYFVCPHAATSCRNRKSVPKQKVEQALIKQLVLRSQQMRAAIRDAKRSSTSMNLMVLTLQGASEERLAEFHLNNQPQYSDLLEINTGETPKSERLQMLESQLQHLEAFPGFNPQADSFKKQLRQDIERERLQSSSLLNKSAGEIVFAGNEGIFWDALSLEQKVDVYPRIIDRLYIQDGQVKQVNLKVEIPEGVED